MKTASLFISVLLLCLSCTMPAIRPSIVRAPSQISSGLNIINESGGDIDEKKIMDQFKKAQDLFEKEIGPINRSTTFSIGPKGCLRTAYDPFLNQVIFCNTGKVINSGLDSIDVFNHEVFHSFLCNIKDDLCLNFKDTEFIHEALADYFSYLLNPDNFFGENYYKDREHIRNYKVSWRVGLVQGAHQKGNALASLFITNNVPLKEAVLLLENNHFSEEVRESVDGANYSHLNRYRLKPGQEIKISFDFDRDSKVSTVLWSSPEGLEITRLSETSALIKFSSSKITEADAFFYSNDGIELGSRHYYFAPKK